MNHYIKISTYFLVLTGCILSALTSCTDQDEPGKTPEMVAVDISAGIQTRASDTQWDAYDAIGITMVYPGTNNIVENTINRLYKTDASGSGKFTADASQQIYFPQDGTDVNFISYYPYRNDLPGNHYIPVNVSDQTSLPEIDLMTAEHLAGFSKETPHVSLHFHHRLTKLSFNIKMDDGVTYYDMKDATLTILGMNTTATYDLFNEQLLDIDNPEIIEVPFSTDAAHRTAIVLPREAGEGVGFTVKFTNGDSYTALLNDDLELKSGFHYKFNLLLEKNELVITVTIEDWTDGGTYSDAFVLNTTAMPDNSGVIDGDTIRAYQLFSSTNRFTHVTTFTYSEDDDIWHPSPVAYWSDMSADNGIFRGYTIRKEAYNDTQLPEIIVSENETVAKGQPINLTLKRAVSQLVFSLTSSDNAISSETLKRMKITLPGYKVGGYVNDEGKFIPGTDTGDIVVQNNVGVNGESSIAIIQPQFAPSSATDAILTSDYGAEYRITFGAIEFKAGETTLIEIDVNATAILMGVTIIDWKDGATIPVTASLHITGELKDTPEFFKDKEIQVYEIGSVDGGYVRIAKPYTYEIVNGQYEWTGDTFYWEETTNMRANLAAVYYPNGVTPTIDRNTPSFTWNIRQAQGYGYETSDLLWSPIQSYSREYVNFEFQHAMSKIVLNLKKGTDVTDADLNNIQVNIKNVYIQGEVNIVNATITPSISAGKNVVTPYPEGNYKYSCLVYPQTISSGEQFISITLPTNYTLFGSLNSDLILHSGKEHVINVTVNKTEMKLSATVKEWETGGDGEVTIE